MKTSRRGTKINFSHEFLDTDGEVTNVATATLKLVYPGEGWPHNGNEYEVEEVDLTENVTTNVWTGEWDSRVSWPGIVFWHIYTDDDDQAVADGHFRLRGNPANMEIEA